MPTDPLSMIYSQNELTLIKSSNAYNFFGPGCRGPVDFEFETSLMPNGNIEGTINMLHSEDVSKTLALTFDVVMAKNDRLSLKNKDSDTLAHFLIDQEPHYTDLKTSGLSSSSKQRKDNSKNNNNSCHTDHKCALARVHSIEPLCQTRDNHNACCRQATLIVQSHRQSQTLKLRIVKSNNAQRCSCGTVLRVRGGGLGRVVRLRSVINSNGVHWLPRGVTRRRW